VIAPAFVLSVLFGLLHTALFVLLRGRVGRQVALVFLAAVLGAWAGDTIADRLAADPVLIGDYHVVGASLVAWLGIGIVTLVGVLGPAREAE
jgi:hypothetical protein